MIAGSSSSVAAPFVDIDIREKRYGERAVLGNLRLSLAPGEIVALLGASGCGKSTLLRIVAGLDRDYTGSVAFNGEVQHGPSPLAGVVFQEPRLLPWLRVDENVCFPERARGEALVRARSLLDEVGLRAEDGARWPKHLSGGMAQRVAIARGLFTQPQLLLLDEPFSAVDAMTRMRLQDLLLTIVQAHGMGALVVTHDIDEALHLADRIVLLETAGGSRSRPASRIFEVDTARPRRREDTPGSAWRRVLLDTLEASAR
ncbi:ABC transporter ATP-binding protein [Paraburkholderia lycopersici]|uniref:Sulfonate transport system ATP-binding protein n=1 Tax=Paraburkholderia lycopersici TaxID=416944 RepID=A0A1G6SKA1_9BURK|nr:ABC transporter ATP-binding protein [Paraburkholderia lycopersici]SDD17268.1 sulfonate transport system ATP-binding protein [Paraburkholderia lycopersici]